MLDELGRHHPNTSRSPQSVDRMSENTGMVGQKCAWMSRGS